MAEFRYAADLPPYDENAGCPKCGGSVGTVYHGWMVTGHDKHGRPTWPCLDWIPVAAEHLCRVCARCGHGWCEATAEAKKPARGTKRGGNVRVLREGK